MISLFAVEKMCLWGPRVLCSGVLVCGTSEYVAFADVPPDLSGTGIKKEWKWGESLLPFLVSPSVGQQDVVEVLSVCQASRETVQGMRGIRQV